MKKKLLTLIISTLVSASATAGITEKEIGLLNNIGYGVTEKSLSIVKKDGIDAWILQQLEKPNFYDDSEIEKRYVFPQTKEEIFPEYKANDFIVAGNKTNVEYFYGDNGIVTKSLLKRVDYALNSENRLREMMVWFWFNHFNIGVYSSNISAMFVNDYEQKIRKNALGNFKDMLRMTTHHPAMLYYLNNASNRDVKNDPVYGINENYARELLELHTLGVNAGYTQRDVRELARILTGVSLVHFSDYDLDEIKDIKTYDEMKKLIGKEYRWSFYNYVLEDYFLFNGKDHDYGNKKFLGRDIKGQGLPELDRVVDILANHPKTARFLSKKMAVYLMNDTPSEEVIEKMVKRYLATKGDIAETLKPLLLSDEFKKTLDKHDKIKDPYTFMLSTVKTGLKNQPGKDKEFTLNLIGKLKNIEDDPYFKKTPEGFSIYGKDWISSARMQENIHYVIDTINKYNTDKKYPVNYKLLEITADKKIKTKEDAIKFLSSEKWLKR